MPDEITTGELGRRLDRLEKAVQDGFKAQDDRLLNTVVTRVEYSAKHEALAERVTDLEDINDSKSSRNWGLITAVAAALVTDLVTLAVVLAQ